MKEEERVIKVMFVCLGNICRSPMAEAVFRHTVEEAGLSDQFEIASSGTSNYHAGERPHPGTQSILKQHGVNVHPAKRAQKLRQEDISQYDYVVAMDAENASDLTRMGVRAPRLLEFAPAGSPKDVPDPYYTNRFEEVYRLVEAGSKGLLDHIRKEEGI
jgi:protein-tyrosine phosphatase